MKHYVVTTRRVSKTDNRYSKNIDRCASFMRCGKYTEGDGVLQQPYFFESGNEDSDYENGTSIAALQPGQGTRELFDQLFAELEQSGKGLLLFLFGIDNPIAKELEHVELLHNAYVKNSPDIGRILMITWPSQGFAGFEYRKELKQDVQLTGKALAVFLLKLSAYITTRRTAGRYVPKLFFMPQSMGHRIVNVMLEHLEQNNQLEQLRHLFDGTILMSPDMPNYALQTNGNPLPYKHITQLSKQLCLVFSKQDPILGMAKWFDSDHSTAFRSLGKMGLVFPVDGVTQLEVEQVNDPQKKRYGKNPEHRYYEFHCGAIEEINKLLVSGQPDTKIVIDWNRNSYPNC
jgi:hypothetical protein